MADIYCCKNNLLIANVKHNVFISDSRNAFPMMFYRCIKLNYCKSVLKFSITHQLTCCRLLTSAGWHSLYNLNDLVDVVIQTEMYLFAIKHQLLLYQMFEKTSYDVHFWCQKKNLFIFDDKIDKFYFDHNNTCHITFSGRFQ